MSVQRFMRTRAVLVIPGEGGYDDMGDPLPAVDVEIETRCRLVQERSIENRDGGVVAVQELKAFLPADLHPVPSTARLRVRGVDYALDGPAAAVDSPRSNRVEFLVAPLRVTT